MTHLKKLISQHKDKVIKIRRDLHRIPELGFQEQKTSSYVADYLHKEGLRVHTGIAMYGVAGLLSGDNGGPTVMIRSELDALPLKESTGLPFASTHDHIMHACGHDGHMAMVLGAATILNTMKSSLNGHVKFVFQPAEESLGGAKPMIDAGVLEDPTVDFSLGCHIWPDIPFGCIGVKSGPLMAAMDRFDLHIIGRGGHGAMPDLSIDALEVGTQVVSALQRITSRHTSPLNPTVVTIGSFHSGTTYNIIPGEAHLMGTTRTFDPAVWHAWSERIDKIVRGVCHSMDAEYRLEYVQGYPPLINDEELAAVAEECAKQVVGARSVVIPERTMGSEDMSFFLEKTKGCFCFLGVGQKGGFPLHNPAFDFNEDILLVGIELYCRIVLALLR